MIYVIACVLETSALPGRACAECRRRLEGSALERTLCPADGCCDTLARSWSSFADRPLFSYVGVVTTVSLMELHSCVSALREPSLSECALAPGAAVPVDVLTWLHFQTGMALVSSIFPLYFQRKIWRRLTDALDLPGDIDPRTISLPKRKVQDCVRHSVAADRGVQLFGALLAFSFAWSLLGARRIKQGVLMQGTACNPGGHCVWAYFCGMYAVCFSVFFLVTAARRGCGVCGEDGGEWGVCGQGHKRDLQLARERVSARVSLSKPERVLMADDGGAGASARSDPAV